MTSPNYSPAHVIRLFDEMAQTYGAVNLISSFGFSHLWRKAMIRCLNVEAAHACADLMCGMGEATELLLKSSDRSLNVEAVDFCSEMTKRCKQTILRNHAANISVVTSDVFDLNSACQFDRVCCSFGLKTLDDRQLRAFAALIKKILKPSGQAAFVEIHVPKNSLLRTPFLFYVRHVIPAIGRLCLGDPNCYRHLARYTEDFASRDRFDYYLEETGLVVNTRPLFFGCARLYFAQRS
jgi:ubiquinone/menaquinone biosynthesis methyltransferase